jgi:hypothetical protein
MLSSLKCFVTHGWLKNVNATGPGSARPVVSSMMLSCATAPAARLRVQSVCSAAMMSLRSEQQTQPPVMVTRSSLDCSWLATACAGVVWGAAAARGVRGARAWAWWARRPCVHVLLAPAHGAMLGEYGHRRACKTPARASA